MTPDRRSLPAGRYGADSTRRDFLQLAAAVASLPSWLRGEAAPDREHWFVDAASGEAWPVQDPVRWVLEKCAAADSRRAAAGLRTLTPAEGERIIRLVTRRCGLNLIVSTPRRVAIHHWGRCGLADLRPFFKTHGLARRRVQVVVRDRKRETSAVRTGEDYLYGRRLGDEWPGDLFWDKWRCRFEKQPDDGSAAPGAWSGYAWRGVEPNRIPWAALKSAWRNTSPSRCANCERPTLLVNFGDPWTGRFSRRPQFLHACRRCRRYFEDESIRSAPAWMIATLDAEHRPDFKMVWDRPAAIAWQELTAG